VDKKKCRSVWVSGFLVMNSDAVDIDEAGVIGMEEDFAVSGPVSIARAQ
jgi:hypothetical protein